MDGCSHSKKSPRKSKEVQRQWRPKSVPVYRACFTFIHAYGLRISEAVTLPISAVDAKQMVPGVIGKGNVAMRKVLSVGGLQPIETSNLDIFGSDFATVTRNSLCQ